MIMYFCPCYRWILEPLLLISFPVWIIHAKNEGKDDARRLYRYHFLLISLAFALSSFALLSTTSKVTTLSLLWFLVRRRTKQEEVGEPAGFASPSPDALGFVSCLRPTLAATVC